MLKTKELFVLISKTCRIHRRISLDFLHEEAGEGGHRFVLSWAASREIAPAPSIQGLNLIFALVSGSEQEENLQLGGYSTNLLKGVFE